PFSRRTRPPSSSLFPYTTLFRSRAGIGREAGANTHPHVGCTEDGVVYRPRRRWQQGICLHARHGGVGTDVRLADEEAGLVPCEEDIEGDGTAALGALEDRAGRHLNGVHAARPEPRWD